MKILMLANKFYPHVGGVEKHLWEVSTELGRRGHEIVVITEHYDSCLPVEEDICIHGFRLKIIRIPKKRKMRLPFVGEINWKAFYRVKDFVQWADLIHCHDFAVFIFWYLPFKLLLPDKPVYITFHGWEGIFPPERTMILLRKLTELSSWGNICIGDFICKWYGTKATYVSYGGVCEINTNSSSLGKDAIFVGRLSSDSGILMYLEALKILKQKNIDVGLTVCGDGPLRNECERFSCDASLRVHFLGFVSEPHEQMSQASFAFVSGYLAILEAMMMKKVVFSVFNNPLKEDYLRMHPCNENMMFVAGSARQLADQLESCILNNSVDQRMRRDAHDWVINQSWSTVADLYEGVWRAKHT